MSGSSLTPQQIMAMMQMLGQRGGSQQVAPIQQMPPQPMGNGMMSQYIGAHPLGPPAVPWSLTPQQQANQATSAQATAQWNAAHGASQGADQVGQMAGGVAGAGAVSPQLLQMLRSLGQPGGALTPQQQANQAASAQATTNWEASNGNPPATATPVQYDRFGNIVGYAPQ